MSADFKESTNDIQKETRISFKAIPYKKFLTAIESNCIKHGIITIKIDNDKIDESYISKSSCIHDDIYRKFSYTNSNNKTKEITLPRTYLKYNIPSDFFNGKKN